jgi:hypothetical protein
MTAVRNAGHPSSTWRTRAGMAGIAAGAILALAPLVATIAAPVTVEARMEDQVPDPCDFATSGGFVVGPTAKKANFGVHGGCKNGAFWGHLNFVDHANGYHVNSVEVTAYLAPQGTSSPIRDVCGIAQTNNPADPEFVYFRARLIDNGEPGSGDQFALKLGGTAAPYEVPLSFLGAARPGGNVQLHSPNPSTVVLPAVDEQTACGGLRFGGGGPE